MCAVAEVSEPIGKGPAPFPNRLSVDTEGVSGDASVAATGSDASRLDFSSG